MTVETTGRKNRSDETAEVYIQNEGEELDSLSRLSSKSEWSQCDSVWIAASRSEDPELNAACSADVFSCPECGIIYGSIFDELN